MKLTDKEIIEALKAGKKIKSKRVSCYLKYDTGYGRITSDRGEALYDLLTLMEIGDFEIVEPEIDWEKVVKEKYLCLFWNHPDDVKYFGYLMKFENKYKTCMAGCIRYFKHCRPLRADEVKLVTDEKELWK